MKKLILPGLLLAAVILTVVFVVQPQKASSQLSQLQPLFGKFWSAALLLYNEGPNEFFYTFKKRWRESFPIGHPDLHKIEKIAELEHPWGMDFVPIAGTDHALVTEKLQRRIAIIENDEHVGEIMFNITGRTIITQEVWQSIYEGVVSKHLGLHGILFDPDYDNVDNRYIYLSATINTKDFSEGLCPDHAVVKVRYDYRRQQLLGEPNIIFESNSVQQNECLSGTSSFGSRMLFLPDKTLLFSVGYADSKISPQDKNLWGGKLIRFDRNGEAVCEQSDLAPNPFCNEPGKTVKYLWTIGHKNIQGIAIDSKRNIWVSEHGEWKGDEINRIVAGKNYGYPYLCVACKPYSRPLVPMAYKSYEKSPYTLHQILISDGLEEPTAFVRSLVKSAYAWDDYFHYDKSIAPAGMDYYGYPGKYYNHLILATLTNQKIELLRITNDGDIIRERPLYQGRRMRDIRIRDASTFYALIDADEGWTLMKFTFRDSVSAGERQVVY